MRILFSTLILGLLTTIGCAPTQAWLQGSVCKCETESACDASSTEVAHAVALHQIDVAHYRAEFDGDRAGAQVLREKEEAEKSENGEADEREAAYRSMEELALEPIDPTLPQSRISLDGEADRESFANTFGIAPPEEGQIFQAAFKRHDRSVLAIHRPGQALDLYRGGSALASLDLSNYDDLPVPDDLISLPTGAIELVRNGSVQIKLIHARQNEDGEISYSLAIYKLIGNEIGTIFHHPIAYIDQSGELTRQGDLRYLHGMDHRTIEWIPLDEEGKPEGEPLRFEWNRWEGVYRVPGPPPTAPRQPQSLTIPQIPQIGVASVWARALL